VLLANHYKMVTSGKIVGFFTIFKENLLTMFHVEHCFSNLSQELFARAKKCENVTGAMVPTGDEFFMSHCLDGFVRLEKEAYFAVYTDKGVPEKHKKHLEMRRADIDADSEILKLSGDFLDDVIKQIKNETHRSEIYIMSYGKEVIGFGVVDYQKIITDVASIGMFVREEYRRQGFAANILEHLKLMCFEKGFRVRSGCWYYNHNSIKSQYAAGAYSKTRLMRFYF